MQIVPKEAIMEDLRRAVHAAGSHQKYANQIGVTRSHVCNVLCGLQEPGPVIARALGYDKKWLFVRQPD